ncbi:MAG: YbhN family protein [Actinomycetota bacterium]|nr:YbhN family protein [Actinomycetota bacterium]
MTATHLSDPATEVELARAEASLEPRQHRRWPWRVVMGVATLGLVWVDVVYLGPYLTTAAGALGHPELRWLLLALGAQFAAFGAFARLQRRMLAAGGTRLSMPRMLTLTYAANALNATLPAGLALSSGYTFRRLRARGVSVPSASFTILASSLLSTLSFAVVALVAWVLAGAGSSGVTTLVVAVPLVLGAALLVRGAIRHPQVLVRAATRVLLLTDRLLHRKASSGPSRVQALVHDLSAVRARPRDWITGLAFAAGNWIADLVCLFACLQAVGTNAATFTLAGVAFVAGKASASASLLPGGLGLADLAMIATFTHGGLSTSAATAGVLLYRLISFVLIVAIGWLLFAGTWYADTRRPVRHPSG